MLILASQSASRRAMLDAAGVVHRAQASPVDEAAVKRAHPGLGAADLALVLAEAKARAVAETVPDALVLGGDSVVEVAGRLFDKPASRAEAAEHLRFFSGQAMHLHAAAVLMRGGDVRWRHGDIAKLHVRPLSEAFIADYLNREWPAVAGCVGVFRIEAMGVQLFENVAGSHFTVLGMPLLPLLGALRAEGELAA